MNYSKGAKRGKNNNKKKIKGISRSLSKAGKQKKTSPHNENAAARSSCRLHQSALGRNGEKCQRKEPRDLGRRFKQVKNHAHSPQNSSARFPPVPFCPQSLKLGSQLPHRYPLGIPSLSWHPLGAAGATKNGATDPASWQAANTAPRAATPGRRSPWRSRRCPPRLYI